MTFSANAILALALGLALSMTGNLALWQYAKAQKAAVAPLREAAKEAADIAETYRRELEACTGQKEALRKASEKAIEEARKAELEAEAEAEAFRKRLANPDKLPAGCQSILTAQVCPALLDY